MIAFLGIVTVLSVVLLYLFISPQRDLVVLESEDVNFSDLVLVINELDQKDSWIYKMYLQKKKNTFSYPQTVYHIKLNSGE